MQRILIGNLDPTQLCDNALEFRVSINIDGEISLAVALTRMHKDHDQWRVLDQLSWARSTSGMCIQFLEPAGLRTPGVQRAHSQAVTQEVLAASGMVVAVALSIRMHCPNQK